MSDSHPKIVVVRHGETEWSVAHRHTGRTDLPLTARGEDKAKQLQGRLRAMKPLLVLTSPLQRARRTCELAGFGAEMRTDADLAEWDYGDYDGLTTAEIQQTRPGWSLFRDGCPNGEPLDEVGRRADAVISRVRAIDADVLLFGHGHMFRVLAARWLALPAKDGALFTLAAASVSALSYDHSIAEPVIALWNGEAAA